MRSGPGRLSPTVIRCTGCRPWDGGQELGGVSVRSTPWPRSWPPVVLPAREVFAVHFLDALATIDDRGDRGGQRIGFNHCERWVHRHVVTLLVAFRSLARAASKRLRRPSRPRHPTSTNPTGHSTDGTRTALEDPAPTHRIPHSSLHGAERPASNHSAGLYDRAASIRSFTSLTDPKASMLTRSPRSR